MSENFDQLQGDHPEGEERVNSFDGTPQQDVVYELRLTVAGNLPAGLRMLSETDLIQMVIAAARASDADEDAFVRITNVGVRRVE